jgi:hypothetical protein
LRGVGCEPPRFRPAAVLDPSSEPPSTAVERTASPHLARAVWPAQGGLSRKAGRRPFAEWRVKRSEPLSQRPRTFPVNFRIAEASGSQPALITGETMCYTQRRAAAGEIQ